MSIFTGSGVAIITPFKGDSINFDEFARLIEFQIQNDTDAIIVCGTTGEPSTMTEEEKRSAIKFCIERVNKRIPVIAGTGGNNTKKCIADSQYALSAGADALLVVTPYYNKCTQDGLVAHYFAIADAVNLPIIVYNVPGRTGVNVLPSTLKKLAAHKNIVGLKEASGNIEQIVEIARLCPEIDLYSGNDDHILPILSLGGKGVISVVANVAPQKTHDLVASFLKGDIIKSRDLQFEINPLVKSLFTEVNPIPVKTACGMMGFDVGELRMPLSEMTQSNKAILRNELIAIGIIKE